jgi:hypothetical protein
LYLSNCSRTNAKWQVFFLSFFFPIHLHLFLHFYPSIQLTTQITKHNLCLGHFNSFLHFHKCDVFLLPM